MKFQVEKAFRLGILLDFIAMFAILEYYLGWEIVLCFALVLVHLLFFFVITLKPRVE